MNDIKKYLDSGIIEDYCLGAASEEDTIKLLDYCRKHPEINRYFIKTQQSIELFLNAYKKKPSAHSKEIIKESILNNIKLKEARLTDNHQLKNGFFGISRHTNLAVLEELINTISPPDFDGIHIHSLYKDDSKELNVVWASAEIPWEYHPDLSERFLILEGRCDCYINDEIISLERGGYIEMPPESKHKVVITSNTPVKAVLCIVKLAA